MSSANNQQKLNAWFARVGHMMTVRTPSIIAETANEYFRESFQRKSFGGVSWKETQKPVKRGSLMVRSGALLNSIRPSIVSADLVRISAGNSKVPYAKVHNEGGMISRVARSETFVRNRFKSGSKKGLFKRGTSSGEGFTFKAYSYIMPQRQFMGHTAELNKRIITRIKADFNSH